MPSRTSALQQGSHMQEASPHPAPDTTTPNLQAHFWRHYIYKLCLGTQSSISSRNSIVTGDGFLRLTREGLLDTQFKMLLKEPTFF